MSYSGVTQQIYRTYANAPSSGTLASLGNLSLSGSSTKSIATGDSVNVTRKLSITGTTLSVGQDARLILVSNATATAWVGELTTGAIAYTGTGTQRGKIEVQRYIGLTNENYRDFASPVKASTLGSWYNAGLEMLNVRGAIAGSPEFDSVYNTYYYVESTAGDLNTGWVNGDTVSDPVHTLNGSAILRSGWRIYAGRTGSDYNFTLNDAGDIYSGDVVLNPTFTHAGSDSRIADDGWNFVGNPYAAGLNWASVVSGNGASVFATDSTSEGVAPSMYIYTPSSAGVDGNGYGAFNAFTGTRIGLSDGVIPAYQGFWMKTFSATDSKTFPVTLKESYKFDGAGTFYKSDKQQPLLSKLTLTGPYGDKDDAGIHFWKNATMNTDIAFDIQKFNADAYGTAISFLTPKNEELWVNAIPENLVNYSMDVQVTAVATGTHTISWDNIGGMFASFTCVTLRDNVTEEEIDMKAINSFSVELEEGYIGKRFTIIATRAVEMAKSTLVNPSCTGAENGLLRLDLNSYEDDHSFTLFNIDGAQQLIGTYKGNIKSVKQILAAGEYKLVNNKAIQNCGAKEFIFPIVDPAPVVASFAVNGTLVQPGTAVSFTNSSSGGNNFNWRFADDMSTSTDKDVSHTYQTPGVFEVELTVSNDDPSCTSTERKSVTVSEPSGLSGKSSNPEFVTVAVKGGIKFLNPFTGEVQLTVFSSDGRLVKSVKISGAQGQVDLDAAGTYVLSVQAENYTSSKQLVILN